MPGKQAATKEQAVAELQEVDDDVSGNGGSVVTAKEHQEGILKSTYKTQENQLGGIRKHY